MSNFSEWMQEEEWGDRQLLEGMVNLHLAWKRYWEANNEPITYQRGKMDFPLKFAGRHLDPIMAPPAKGQERIIRGPDQNFLIPMDSLQEPGPDGKTPKGLSHFVRDQPYIGAFTQASPENMASAVIFVLMTIRADFMQVMHSFPLVMSLLMSRFGNRPIEKGELAQAMFDMEGKVAASSKNSVVSRNDATGKQFRQGYGNGGQLFGFKYDGVEWVWNNRDTFYSQCMNLVDKKDTVGVFQYIATHVKGLAQPKAGFCVQLIFGELGCIDMHNVNLYSQYYLDRGQPKSTTQSFQPDTMKGDQLMKSPGKRDLTAYTQLNPKVFSPTIQSPGPMPSGQVTSRELQSWKNKQQKLKGAVKAYMDVLKILEQDGFNTIKLWDIWVSYVSKAYNKADGSTRYARDGRLAGNPLDPKNDPVDRKIMQTRGPIPDRNAILTQPKAITWKKDPKTGLLVPHKAGGDEDALPTYSVQDMDKEDSAGSASLSHGAIHWWRNPDYWWDLINQANGERAKDGVRYASDQWAGPVSDVPRALPYLDKHPELIDALFHDDDEKKSFRKALKDVLKKHDFYNVDRSDKPTKASRYAKKKNPTMELPFGDDD